MKKWWIGGALVVVAACALAADATLLRKLAFDEIVKAGQAVAASAAPSSADAGQTGMLPLKINGRQWTFHTPPPKGIKVRADHPRLLITKESLPDVQAKLENVGLYGKEMKAIVKEPALQALFYAVYGDVVAGEMAKKALLEVPEGQKSSGRGTSGYFWCLVYDWCHDLFTPAEREIAMRRIMKDFRLEFPAPGESEVKETRKAKVPVVGGFAYDNDPHEPVSHSFGYQLRGGIALAFYGDGVRDEWCESVFQTMLDGKKSDMIYPIYEASGGGLLDGHNSLALDSGGCQAGHHTNGPISGYNEMFMATAPMLMAAWESATGDELFGRDNFFRKLPLWVAYDIDVGQGIGSNMGAQVLTQLTGIYKTIDPDMASLAAWLTQKHGEGRYNELVTLILGDRTVVPKSPEELGLSASAFLRGGDCCYSQTGWSDLGTRVVLTTRTVDVNRYEPYVGLLSVSSRGEKLLIVGQEKKGRKSTVVGSGIWIWPTGKPATSEQGSTYWGDSYRRFAGTAKDPNRVRRANSPLKVATLPGYSGVLPTEDHGDASHHVFAVDSEKFFSFDDYAIDVKKCKRTVVHLKPDDQGREFVVVYDRVHVGGGLSHLWGGRFMNEPRVNDNEFVATNKSMAIHGTVLSPKSRLAVRGGPGKATEGPNGESYDKMGYIFKDDDSGREVFGSYALFIEPTSANEQQDYCVVLEIGAAGFAPAKAMIVDNIVTVGGWRVDFTTEDATKVSHQ